MKTTTNIIYPAFAALALAWLAVSPVAQGVNPPPGGGYPGANTAAGTDALFTLTTGISNTGLGFQALYHNTTGEQNTATGRQALFSNTTGDSNTANGVNALTRNTVGFQNTAIGVNALTRNTTGDTNTAIGYGALWVNTTGGGNTATGVNALFGNTTGNNNTATGGNALTRNTTGLGNTANGVSALTVNTTGNYSTATGYRALFSNTTGDTNTANGNSALYFNTTGKENTANGVNALARNTTGNSNTALGTNAGFNRMTGSRNIDIGANVFGVAGESNTIRIGSAPNQTRTFIAGIDGTVVSGSAVVVSAGDQLGVAASSQRFKDEIRSMDKASEAILALKPVTFRYKKEIDPQGVPQFGLVAEDVEKVNADLVVRDKEGKPYSVRYDQVNAMLLNEFLKEHRKAQQQEATIAQLKQDFRAAVAELNARLKEQDSKIEKVSAQIEASKPSPQTVVNNP